MHGRTETVELLISRGAELDDRAFDDEGPTPLDCALRAESDDGEAALGRGPTPTCLWGFANNRAEDGDYAGTVEALVAAGAPAGRDCRQTGDEAIDALLAGYARDGSGARGVPPDARASS